jgi:hypothetical protein
MGTGLAAQDELLFGVLVVVVLMSCFRSWLRISIRFEMEMELIVRSLVFDHRAGHRAFRLQEFLYSIRH